MPIKGTGKGDISSNQFTINLLEYRFLHLFKKSFLLKCSLSDKSTFFKCKNANAVSQYILAKSFKARFDVAIKSALPAAVI